MTKANDPHGSAKPHGEVATSPGAIALEHFSNMPHRTAADMIAIGDLSDAIARAERAEAALIEVARDRDSWKAECDNLWNQAKADAQEISRARPLRQLLSEMLNCLVDATYDSEDFARVKAVKDAARAALAAAERGSQ